MVKGFHVALLVMILTMQSVVQTKFQKPVLRGSNQYAINNAFTGKEICVLKVVNKYKMHFLKYVLYRRAKSVMRLYKLEHSRRKSDRLHSLYESKSDWNSRALVNPEVKQYNKMHLHKFIKKMGSKMKIFGRVFTYKELKNKYSTLKKLRENWIRTVRKGSSFNIESSLAANIQNLLMHQFGLPKKYQMQLSRCKLNTISSMQKCQKMYGPDSCVVLYSGVVHKKCPQGLERVGCCSCAPACPNNHFIDNLYFCKPKENYKLDQYHTLSECQKEQKSCMKFEEKFTGECKPGFERDRDFPECRAQCPQGWKEINESCLKPGIISLGTPFVWDKSDN